MISEEDEIIADKDYCRNPACNCIVPAGVEYCDDYCRTVAAQSDSDYCQPPDIERGLSCRCGHSEC